LHGGMKMAGSLELYDQFDDRLEALRAFGFNGRALMQAIWRIPNQSKKYVWIAWSGRYQFGVNTLSPDGRFLKDCRDPQESGADSYAKHVPEDREYILFMRNRGMREVTFKGVFVPDLEKSFKNVSAWRRVSVECSLPDGQWQASAATL